MRSILRTRALLGGAVVTLALVLAGCGSSAPSAPRATAPTASSGASGAASGPTRIPYLTDEEDPVGTTRVLFAMLDTANNSIGAPDLVVNVAFYDAARSTANPTSSGPATFIWAIPDQRGIYEITATFAEPGDWIAEFTSVKGGRTERTRVQFQISAKSSSPVVGAKAPDTRTPTLADVGGDVKQLSTDTSPDLDFYRVSAHDALAQHKPFVLVFATPAFCTSRVCGPTLDAIKAIAKSEPGMTFINVEPYQMTYTGGHLQPVVDAQNNLQATDVTNAWGILTEPWIFVVDRDGIVRGTWSTVVSAAELTAAIDAVK
jgi:hypothetical protein